MIKYFEIDFLEAGDKGSGDAICLRYEDEYDRQFVHVVDGGYTGDGQKMLDHIDTYYGRGVGIDHVVLTHPDGDHAAGLKTILENREVGVLWMNRPWNYIDELIPLFDYAYTPDGLRRRLRKDFPYTRDLEDIAHAKGIEIRDALQGAEIGMFTVLAPSRGRYIDLIVQSEKTPEAQRRAAAEGTIFERAVSLLKSFVAGWGEENLKGDTEGTSRENEASIVQFSGMCGQKTLLTADAGVEALEEAHNYAIGLGVELPGIDKFQVPHHGSRRNISPEILDKWLGPKLSGPIEGGAFSAIVSANRNDSNHPRKATVRALIHRGAKVVPTEGTIRTGYNAPKREGWSAATPIEYPSENEA